MCTYSPGDYELLIFQILSCILFLKEVVSKDLYMMGVEVISFTLKDVTDNVDHLEALGRAEIADAAKEAAIGITQRRIY